MSGLYLLQEFNDTDIKASVVEADGKTPNFYIEGVFMQSDVKNQNNRIYPQRILAEQVNNYNTEFVDTNRALGELDHPPTPVVNLQKVSHVIEELKYINKTDVYGRARLIDTPMGNIGKAFIRENIRMGISSRALGTVKDCIVESNMKLIAADIVADPSAKVALVNGIMESRQWIIDDGVLTEAELESTQTMIDTTTRTLGSLIAEQKIFDILIKNSEKFFS